MSLDTIKKRISSIKTTSKITNAMKLVASSKISKQKALYSQIKDYYEDYYQIVGNILSLSKNTSLPKDHKCLYIVITSTLGLCGGYNTNVIKHVLSEINPQDFVLQIGLKGREYFKNNLSPEQIIDFNLTNSNMSYEECMILSKKLVDILHNEKKVDAIKLVYTKFVNAITFTPETLSLIPFDEKLINSENKLTENDFEFEPNKETIIQEILLSYFSSVIYGSIVESSISESASRRNAMDTATDNATELMSNLQLMYNRVRQSKITNEITEIVAGSKEE